ncbi:MAG: alpha/beta hydrolase [Planctomycetes bacterium]|nr:alpha/beta hydrolase [Planctomycetota bacterium]
MFWLWVGLAVLGGVVLIAFGWAVWFYLLLRRRFIHQIVRCFQEMPLLIAPRGQPISGAEDVAFPTSNGLTLRGCYLRAAGPRQGVILFGLEFGSNRWACLPYCEHLRAQGFDLFSFEPRSQGESDRQPGYEPLQWITDYEVADFQAALKYLQGRSDADPRGIGFFGISKGGGAGLLAAARDPLVRCFVTDGIFATDLTMLPYMRKWIRIYSTRYWLQTAVPDWVYSRVGRDGLRKIEKARRCRFPHLEWVMPRLAPRPLLMIHGGADTYIKPDMARALFGRAREPKELWLVEGAKHNQALTTAGDDYRRRVLEFFQVNLAQAPPVRTKPLLAKVGVW